MRKILTAGVLFAAVLAFALVAALPACRAATIDCAHAETQADMNACAGQDYRRSDAALNDAYRQAAARLRDDAAAGKLLVAAQRAWIRFRDAECAFASSSVRGGSILPMIEAGCMARLTAERTRVLQSYLHCAEGDLSCPLPPPH